ncbi:AAA family ATPase [Paraburkholderia ginsengiterrae]|uniref:AAA family ATPase n=1 Tax=Paraburkholderia ginsengiterrae TaxID=1462993 RepID=A0A1A9NEN3_9BURK|nr:AAA family ATPase [Paraburkholderia ginsengiterrae]OAJ63735.1 AAA family ATPase [Paraburkholderia ginsengiterrae]OAJ65096.1 AAA family ATPase [Paraburkholderia ginsengiterrae]
MNAPDLPEDDNLGLYQHATEAGAEWWRVSVADRPETYRLEHGVDNGSGPGPVDIDLVVDAENLRAKLKKWRREGFAIDTDSASGERSTAARVAFMPQLQRAAALAAAAKQREANGLDAGMGTTVRIGHVDVPCGAGHALVPAVNPAYLFAERFNDIVEDIVENRRVMLIGHTGAGKTSLIEQVAARSRHGVLRSNMNGQTTVGDFVGFWTVKGGETLWVDGVLPTAMREGLWLIVDEIDFAEPSILAALTAVLEPRGRLVLKEKGNEIVAPHPAFRLFATANAVGAMSQFRHLYQGANLMNEAFLDRWRVYLLDYLTPAEEANVLISTLAPHMTRPLATTLAAIAADCRAAFAREDLSSAFSTRRLLDWAELMLRTGDPERAAGPAIYSKVSPEDAALIRGIVRHHIAPAA